MAATFISTAAGTSADYIKYIQDTPVKSDRVNEPDLLDFTLASIDGSFVKLQPGYYIKLTTDTYGLWFTGYITNDPDPVFLGRGNSGAVWAYKYQATSDDYILNLQPIGYVPPYINTTQGAVLKDLVSRLDPNGTFNTSNIGTGLALASYTVDPNKKFGEIVKEFSDATNYRFYALDHALYFRAADADPAGIIIDGNDKNFTPANLQITPRREAITNDVTVIGRVEPGAYVTEYFLGDSLTAQFPLVAGVFGLAKNVILDEVFQGSQLDTNKWTVFGDATNTYLKVDSGYLNCLGGNNAGAPDVYLQSVQPIALEGNMKFTHGDWDIVSLSSGVICGLWTTTPSAAYTGCIYGLELTKSGANTVIKPIVNGAVDGSQSMTISSYSYRYIIRTFVTFNDTFRLDSPASYVDSTGTVGTFGGTGKASTPTFTTTITRVDPSNGNFVDTTTFTNTGSVLDKYTLSAYYVPMASIDLHATVTFITVSIPVQATLEHQDITGGFSGTTWTRKLIGANEIDMQDYFTPAATITETSGAGGIQQYAGDPDTVPYSPNPCFLTYYKNTDKLLSELPAKGTMVRLKYRRAVPSIARVSDITSILSQQTTWGDNGRRSMVANDLKPTPRNSSECEIAAGALLKQFSYRHYQGTYTLESVVASFTSQPKAGTLLTFQNLPAATFPSISKEIISEVTTEFVSAHPETFRHTIRFGDKFERDPVLDTFEADQNVPQDTASIAKYVDVNAIQQSYSDDIINAYISAYNSTTYTLAMNQNPPLVANQCLYTEQLDNAVWQKLQTGTAAVPTVTPNAVNDPNGSLTADQVDFPLTDSSSTSRIGQQVNVGWVSGSMPITCSVWLRAAAPLTINLAAKHGTILGGGGFNNPCSLTTSWQRFSITIDMNSFGGIPTTDCSFYLLQDLSQSAKTVYSWGWQIELGSTVSGYYTNTSSRSTDGGFEARYTDFGWGSDDGKNLITRNSATSFTVPRNARGKSVYLRTYDQRNRLKWSEDLSNAAWQKVSATVTQSVGVDPDGKKSVLSNISFSATPVAVVYQIPTPTINAAGCTATFGIWLKGTAGQQIKLKAEAEVSPFNGTLRTITFTGNWQYETVTSTWASTDGGSIAGIIINGNSSAKSFQATRAQLEFGSKITTYCKTKSTLYGANSRYSAIIRPNLPLTPSAPTSATIDYTDYINPKITVTLPTNLQDIWGIEVRASDNSTVLYKKDLTDASFNPVVQITGNNSLSLSYYVYFYNLLGEYSSGYNVTATIPRPLEKVTNGKNGIYNPSFEVNTTSTVHNASTWYTTEDIYLCDDWKNNSASNTMWRFHLDSPSYAGDTTAAYSGNYSFRAELKPSLAIPNGTSNSEFRVKSNWFKVTPGNVVTVAARMRWDANTAFPAGVSAIQRIGIIFKQADGTDISEYVADITGSIAWTLKAKAAVVPSNAAYAEVELAAFVSNSSGSTFNTTTLVYAQLRWDDIFFSQQSSTLEHSGVNTANTPSPNPLSQSGTSTTISVSSFSIYYGFGTVTYNSGSISGLSYGLKYYVYTDDPSFGGGSVTYQATTNSRDLTNAEGRIYIGSITLSAGGGATGSGGGSGACLVAGTMIRLQDGTEKPIEELTVGDILMSPYETEPCEFVSMDEITDAQLYRITLSDGRSITCSGTHHLLVNGLWLRVQDIYWPNAKIWCEGEEIGLPATCEVLGTGTIYRLHLTSPHIYLGGGIWSHNMIDPSNK